MQGHLTVTEGCGYPLVKKNQDEYKVYHYSVWYVLYPLSPNGELSFTTLFEVTI